MILAISATSMGGAVVSRNVTYFYPLDQGVLLDLLNIDHSRPLLQ